MKHSINFLKDIRKKRIDYMNNISKIDLHKYIEMINSDINKYYSLYKHDYLYYYLLHSYELRLLMSNMYEYYEMNHFNLYHIKRLFRRINKTDTYFNIHQFDCNFNGCISTIDCKEWIHFIFKYNTNIIYKPEQSNDYYHFYTKNASNSFTIDRYLHTISTYLRENYIDYNCTLFKTIYYNIFNHNEYHNKNIKQLKQTNVYNDCFKIIQNILFACDWKLFYNCIIDNVIKYCKYNTPNKNDIFTQGVVKKPVTHYNISKNDIIMKLWNNVSITMINNYKEHKIDYLKI